MSDDFDKLCRTCYDKEFPDTRPGVITLGRQCTRCHIPTPPGATLIKVNRHA